jgi:hypothetical protein
LEFWDRGGGDGGGEEANGQWWFGLFEILLNLKYFISIYRLFLLSALSLTLSLSTLYSLNWTAGFELI